MFMRHWHLFKKIINYQCKINLLLNKFVIKYVLILEICINTMKITISIFKTLKESINKIKKHLDKIK